MSEEDKDQENGPGADEDWAAAMEEQTAASEPATEAADAADWGDALKEQAAAETQEIDDFKTAEFQDFGEHENVDDAKTLSEDVNLDVILDVPVTISMEIGRTLINIRNLLQLNQGSVVELDRLAGEPMDVLVNGTLIAHGEVVVVNDKFGIRLTDVISPTERVKKLG